MLLRNLCSGVWSTASFFIDHGVGTAVSLSFPSPHSSVCSAFFCTLVNTFSQRCHWLGCWAQLQSGASRNCVLLSSIFSERPPQQQPCYWHQDTYTQLKSLPWNNHKSERENKSERGEMSFTSPPSKTRNVHYKVMDACNQQHLETIHVFFLTMFREELLRTKVLQVRENLGRAQIVTRVFVPFNTWHPPEEKKKEKKRKPLPFTWETSVSLHYNSCRYSSTHPRHL